MYIYVYVQINWTKGCGGTRSGNTLDTDTDITWFCEEKCCHGDVTMGVIASQITILAIIYSTVYSDADQRKHQSSSSLAFARGIHRGRWIPCTNGQLRGKCFHLMRSLCVDQMNNCKVLNTYAHSISYYTFLKKESKMIRHWGRVMHICLSTLYHYWFR